jgi:hypothetical protein
MPQAVAVWCRQLGHDVTYATHFAQQEPRSLLPADLDVVFVCTYTHASPGAYAMAKLFRSEGTLTVIGGPHARSFPADCLRFFDIVVQRCDKELLQDILGGAFAPGSVVSSAASPTELPSVEERLPFILDSSLTHGRRPLGANVPLLSSIGCPYACDFCLDWSSPYVSVPPERLVEDLRFISTRLPGVFVSFHDPNFGVRFDETMAALETVPPAARNPYFMESSLSILKGPRLKRLADTNCHYVAPGLEGWGDYSNKAGVGTSTGSAKLAKVVAHFHELHEHVPNLQANFIFGTDTDSGDEPVELTRAFIREVPYAWPVVNIPTPFGGTPLQERQLAQGRVLTSMPFGFYYMPYLVMTLKNYSPVEYYDRLVAIQSAACSWSLLPARIGGTPTPTMKWMAILRSFGGQGVLSRLKGMRDRLARDRDFLAFHEGRTSRLPAFYRELMSRRLGPHAGLLSESDLTPDLTVMPEAVRTPAIAAVHGG